MFVFGIINSNPKDSFVPILDTNGMTCYLLVKPRRQNTTLMSRIFLHKTYVIHLLELVSLKPRSGEDFTVFRHNVRRHCKLFTPDFMVTCK